MPMVWKLKLRRGITNWCWKVAMLQSLMGHVPVKMCAVLCAETSF